MIQKTYVCNCGCGMDMSEMHLECSECNKLTTKHYLDREDFNERIISCCSETCLNILILRKMSDESY